MNINIKLGDFCKNTLYFIANDINNIDNPIKYHNKIFNNNWNKNTDMFYTFYNAMYKILNEIDITNIKKTTMINYNWKPKVHDKPYNYLAYIKDNKTNLTYDEFKKMYNLRKIKTKRNYIYYINNYNINIPDKIKQILNKFQNGYFADLDVKLYVENNINNCNYYQFQHMNFYYFYNDMIDDQLLIHIYLISKWIYIIKPKNKITFIYFDTPLKKEYNGEEFKYLSSQNINTGLSSDDYIMLWRKEEILKVLIHELIHYLDMDIKHDEELYDIIKYNIGKIDYPILINESITELQSQFLHTLYLSIFIKGNHYENFKMMYNYEQIFSWYQFAKIMKFYNIKDYNVNNLINNFNQTTNVFSYYILKSLMTLHFSDLLFTFDHFKIFINSTYQHCNVDKCNVIIKYIKKIYYESFNKYTKLLNKIINMLNINDQSLRMTIFGIY